MGPMDVVAGLASGTHFTCNFIQALEAGKPHQFHALNHRCVSLVGPGHLLIAIYLHQLMIDISYPVWTRSWLRPLSLYTIGLGLVSTE